MKNKLKSKILKEFIKNNKKVKKEKNYFTNFIITINCLKGFEISSK